MGRSCGSFPAVRETFGEAVCRRDKTQNAGNTNNAWYRRFSGGGENTSYKTSSYRVRPCRR